MTIGIRNYSSSDFNRLTEFYGKTAEHISLLGNSDSEFLIQKLKRPGYDPFENIFLAEYKNKLFGYADLVYEEGIKRAIIDIFVDSPHRRQGVGKEFLDRLLRRGRELGAQSLQAYIPEFNQKMSSFLLHQKFSFIRSVHTLQLEISKKMFGEWDLKGRRLKTFKKGEEDKLAALQNKVFSGTWGFCPNTVEEIKYYLQLTGCRIDEVLCLEDKGNKIAYLWSHSLPQDSGANHLRIHMFGVDPEFRGKGFGKKLLQKALYQMEKQGTKTVELSVDSDNMPAFSLYESLGFKLKSISTWYERKI